MYNSGNAYSYIINTRFIFQTIHQNDIKINCPQTVQRKHLPWFSFNHLKTMAAINQLNNFLLRNNCYSIVFVWQLNSNVFIAYDITRSHKNKATS